MPSLDCDKHVTNARDRLSSSCATMSPLKVSFPPPTNHHERGRRKTKKITWRRQMSQDYIDACFVTSVNLFLRFFPESGSVRLSIFPPPRSWSIWEKDRLNTSALAHLLWNQLKKMRQEALIGMKKRDALFVSSVTIVRAACVCWPPPGRHRKKRDPAEPLPNMCRFRLKSPNVLSCWPWIIERRRQQSRTTRNAPGNL